MSSGDTAKKWKNALLKSSLPLEYLIADKLNKLGIYVAGEYSFLRPNEIRVSTEFSTDFWAFKFLEKDEGKENSWASVNFLIECKYVHPNIRWVFSPNPCEDDILIGYINTFQDLTVNRITTDSLYTFDESLEYCMKGVELQDDNVNPEGIKRGLTQLRYASVQQSKRIMTNHVCSRNDKEMNIDFLCPILVTSAPLYVLKKDLSLNSFRDAEQLDDVAIEVDRLIVNTNRGPEFEEYVKEECAKFRRSYPYIDEWLRDFDRILRQANYTKYRMPDAFFLSDKLGLASERILFVTYDHFEQTIQELIDLISATKATLRQYARLEFSPNTGTVSVKPFEMRDPKN